MDVRDYRKRYEAELASQSAAIDAVSAADGDADRVYRDRIVAGEIRQQLEAVRVREKILGMDLEPSHGWTRGHHLGDVGEPKTDAGDGHILLLATSAEDFHRRCVRSSRRAHRSRPSDRC